MHNQKTSFKKRVISVVEKIPVGKVVSYGQVALYIGTPRAARQVGWILNKLEENTPLPWWRVVNNQGRISIKGSKYSADLQKQLLLQEGILIQEDLTFDIEEYRFEPDEKFIKNLKLEPDYLDAVSNKLPLNNIF